MTTGSEGNEYREFIPKTTFYYGEIPSYSAKVSPRWVEFNTVRAGERDAATVTLKNNGLNSFVPTVAVAAPFVASVPAGALEPGSSCTVEVAFEPTEAGEFSEVLTIDCGEAGIIEVPYTFLADGLIVGYNAVEIHVVNHEQSEGFDGHSFVSGCVTKLAFISRR